MTKKAIIALVISATISYATWLGVQVIDMRNDVAVLKSNMGLLLQTHAFKNTGLNETNSRNHI